MVNSASALRPAAQKHIGRIHQIDPRLLECLWEPQIIRIPQEAVILEIKAGESPLPEKVRLPQLPGFIARDRSRYDFATKHLRTGLSLELQVEFATLLPGHVLLDNRHEAGYGFALVTAGNGAVELIMNDGVMENRWQSDPGLLTVGVEQHIVVVIDGGPHLIMFIINGRLCDGGNSRQFGWGRFSQYLSHLNGDDQLRLAQPNTARLRMVRIYNRRLYTAEAIAAYRMQLRTSEET
jgi:hypothetical protein